jgi:hypothetical protein
VHMQVGTSGQMRCLHALLLIVVQYTPPIVLPQR